MAKLRYDTLIFSYRHLKRVPEFVGAGWRGNYFDKLDFSPPRHLAQMRQPLITQKGEATGGKVSCFSTVSPAASPLRGILGLRLAQLQRHVLVADGDGLAVQRVGHWTGLQVDGERFLLHEVGKIGQGGSNITVSTLVA